MSELEEKIINHTKILKEVFKKIIQIGRVCGTNRKRSWFSGRVGNRIYEFKDGDLDLKMDDVGINYPGTYAVILKYKREVVLRAQGDRYSFYPEYCVSGEWEELINKIFIRDVINPKLASKARAIGILC